MKLLDLFSGIGGFSLAARWTEEIETVCFVENNKFCQKVLNKNFPKVPIINDIKEFTLKEYEGKTGLRTTDIISGGFPCQPFSIAGRRKGKEDNRYLWDEMYRVIQLVKPKWIVAENVYGLLNIEGGLVFEQICIDLERENYEVQTFIIPAASVNAPHKRDRVWIIANTRHLDGKRKTQKNNSQEKDTKKNAIELERPIRRNILETTPDTSSEHSKKHKSRNKSRKESKERTFRRSIYETNWGKNWIEVATELLGVDDGLPDRLHKNINRVDRMKALGNAIVPQVAYQIFLAILESEKNDP
jgi:DNA (cytosine-5)-methyltransferase 1